MGKILRNVLLNPGPATTTDTVKYAQVVPDICPREEEFGHVLTYISTELTRFVGDPDAYQTVLFGGAGTAAVESMLSSVVAEDDSLLIINNGTYGERMCAIANVYGVNFMEYKSPVDQALDMAAVEAFVRSSGQKVTHLAVVHHETSSGLLNDLSSIGELCRKKGWILIVDAMSSYAAIPLDMRDMNISYMAASSNKNLQGMAGVSFVIAHRDMLAKTKESPPRNYYLHLYAQYDFFERTQQIRFTPPVQTLYALKQAIIELKQEGIENRYARYAQCWQTLLRGIERLGLDYVIDKTHHSRLITAIYEPHYPRYDFNKMHDYLYSRGYTIYPGKLDQLDTFRVANIGAITQEDIEDFLDELQKYLRAIGFYP